MRLAIINEFYVPDVSPTAKLAASLAKHRALQGNLVSVITSWGSYAAPQKDQSSLDVPLDAAQSENAIYRIWSSRCRQRGFFLRAFEIALFFLLAAWRVVRLPRQDVIVVLTSPPFIAWIAVLYKVFYRKTRVVLWNMDCYPEVAEQAGVIRKNGLTNRILRLANRILFRWLDHVICLDEEMRSLLASSYANSSSSPETVVIPNWEDSMFSQRVSGVAKQSESNDKFVVLYSGNMGIGHDFETVLKAADSIDDDGVVFSFNGGGKKKEKIEKAVYARQLKNVQVSGYVDGKEFAGVLANADCALITLRDEMLGIMSPSKLATNLAAGLPVMYVGPENSNVDVAIKRYGCGISLRHGDVDGVIAFIKRLKSDVQFHRRLRQHSLTAFHMGYCERLSLAAFDDVIDNDAKVAMRDPAETETKRAAA